MVRMRSSSDTPLSRQHSAPSSLERHSMMEFSGQGRPGRPGRATPMTPEERQGQKERKVAMRKALRELLSDRDTITSRSQRIKLKIASAAVRTTTQIGRKGPAAGSVLDHREHQLRDQHHTQQSMREESIQAVLAAISARIDELEGEEGSPRSVQSAPTEPGMGSPISVPMYMSEMVGTWKNIQTNNLEAYLKHMGVGWAKRKIALAFKPEPSFALVDGVLQVLMPSPIGERLERFPLDAEEQDTDPYGKTFYKRTWWEGSVLTQSATYPNGKTAETLTTRQIDADGHLVQRTTNSGVTFERIFQRKQ